MIGKSPVESSSAEQSSAAPMPGWLTLNAAATYTSRSKKSLRLAVASGALPRHQPGGPGTMLYFTALDLDAYMRGERREADVHDGPGRVPENEKAPAAATVGG